MNNLPDLENILRQMPLRQPSPSLDRRILNQRRLWMLPAVAAGLLMALLPTALLYQALRIPPHMPPAGGTHTASHHATLPGQTPVIHQQSSVVTYEGIVDDERGSPMRVYRIQELSSVQWEDADGTTTVEDTVPTEHLIFVAALAP